MNKAQILKGILEEKSYIDEVYMNIFNILHEKGNLEYTNNNNGIFFNISVPDNEELVSEVLEYLENIQSSHQNHVKNLNNIENTIDNFKSLMVNKENVAVDDKKKKPRTRGKVIKNPFKQEYKGVYKRINDIMKKKGSKTREFAEYEDLGDGESDDSEREDISEREKVSDTEDDLEEDKIDEKASPLIDQERELEIELFGDISDED